MAWCSGRATEGETVICVMPLATAHLMQGAPPPYDLPREYAERAQQIFDQMCADGVEPNEVHFHNLTDAKVSRPCP